MQDLLAINTEDSKVSRERERLYYNECMSPLIFRELLSKNVMVLPRYSQNIIIKLLWRNKQAIGVTVRAFIPSTPPNHRPNEVLTGACLAMGEITTYQKSSPQRLPLFPRHNRGGEETAVKRRPQRAKQPRYCLDSH